MSPELTRKWDLAKRATTLNVSVIIQRDVWTLVAPQAIEEENLEVFDQAHQVLTLLEDR